MFVLCYNSHWSSSYDSLRHERALHRTHTSLVKLTRRQKVQRRGTMSLRLDEGRVLGGQQEPVCVPCASMHRRGPTQLIRVWQLRFPIG
jgi:hypothetical protein